MRPRYNPALAAQRTIDSEALRLAARRQTELDMQRTATPYERKGDGVDWARAIVARDAAGEGVPMLALKWAKDALQVHERPRQPGEDDEP